MIFRTDISKQTITINDIAYSRNDIVNMDMAQINEPFLFDLFSFLKEWFADSPNIEVQTSGSTGVAKQMKVEKMRMMQSARLTCSFLGLKTGDTALLCMNLKYIGAKMLVVRALLSGLNLIPVEVCGNPMRTISRDIHFAAMTPLQVFNSVRNEEERKKLKNICHLIIGGGSIDAHLSQELANFPHAVWSTYGMTETLSHIALRRINGSDASDWYIPLNNVVISLSEKQTLIIDAPLVASEKVVTNDIAEINTEGNFKILGRLDNVINSGGVKIQIEEVERILKSSIHSDFMITSVSDSKFGELVVLLVKGSDLDKEELENICKELLPKYWIPKHIFLLDNVPLTETNKPDRNKAKQIANELYTKIKTND